MFKVGDIFRRLEAMEVTIQEFQKHEDRLAEDDLVDLQGKLSEYYSLSGSKKSFRDRSLVQWIKQDD